MTDLIYPTLKLFVYDFQEKFEENQPKIIENSSSFLQIFQKLPENIRNVIIEVDNENPQADYLELLDKKQPDQQPIYKFSSTTSGHNLAGFYYPVRLYDTYSLLLDCSIDDKNSPQLASTSISILKQKIDEEINNKSVTLRQTWVIAGCLPNPGERNTEAVAKICYKSLIPDGDWEQDYQEQGFLLGGNIFELWQYDFNFSKNNHVIIIFYPNIAIEKTAATFQFDWLPLFYYRHKIIYAYSQSQAIKQQLEKNFKIIQEEYIKKFPKKDSQWLNFKQLQETLVKVQSTLVNYSISLSYLENRISTIEINLLNYQRRLVRIKEKATSENLKLFLPSNILSQLPISVLNLLITSTEMYSPVAQLVKIPGFSDLKFLENFSNEVTEKYLLQVQKDNANLSPGLRLLENLINSIRGITEINQAERDRTFQYWAGILGVGLASAALGVSVATDKLDKHANDPVRSQLNKWMLTNKSMQEPQPWWFEPAIPLIYGVGVGFIFAVLTWLLISLQQRSR
ncbi:hypothetical protein [Nostoc sp.]|uniref:hypothetical protein n=1 Tax=Nostoc sp. TaxID=1180 RepID=UPI002FF917A7